MDINQLVYFISVAQTLNFSEAARRNYVSQSTVSRYVSDLEKEFGVKLFTRSHRDVVITNEGKTLLPYAIETVETLNKAKNVIKQMRDGGNGKLTIASDATSLSFPSKCIAKFNNKVLYSTFIVKVDYSITLPWRFIFSSEPTVIRLCSRAEEPINDTPEFIRNTDMVLDMLDSSTTYKKICDKFGKVKNFINNFVQK